MQQGTNQITRVIPAIVMMGVIFFLSHQPGDSIDLQLGLHVDKILHALIYALLCFSYIYAAQGLQKHLSNRLFDILILLLCILYGFTDEWHQSFVPNRTPSLADIGADGFGALLALFFWRRLF